MSTEPKYEYVLRIPPGLRLLVMRYADGRKCSFNRAVVELLESHPRINTIYTDIISGSGKAGSTRLFQVGVSHRKEGSSMPGVGASNTVNTVLNSAITTGEIAASTTIAESIGTLSNDQGLRVRGVLNFTTAATGTGVQVKCRQGSGIGGTQVGATLTHTMANSASAQVAFDFLDTAPASGNNLYTITLLALTIAGTLNAITVGVEVCNQYQTGSE